MRCSSSRLALSLVAVSMLAGCATDIRQDAQSHNAAYNADADRNQAVLDNVQAYRGPSNVRVMPGIYLGDEGMRSKTGEPLPDAVEGPNGFSFTTQTPLSLDQIAREVSTQSGIRVSVENIALYGRIGQESNAATPVSGANDAFGSAALTGSIAGVPSSPMTIDRYHGPLSGLLDQIADHFDIDWDYHNGVVRFLGVQTREFTLQALPTILTSNATIQGSIQSGSDQGAVTSGGGSQSGAQQGATSQISLDYWKQVDGTLKSILPAGTAYSVNRDAGTITVTARPSVLDQVETYVRTENQRLARQVAIQVKVLSIQNNNDEDYNFDPTIAFNDAAKGLSFAYASPAALGDISNAAASTVGIVRNAAGTNTNGGFNGSNLAIKALSERTNASLVTSASVTAMNNQTAPISILNQQGYLAQLTQTLVQGSSTSSVSLTPGQVNTGFTMSVLPRIMSNNELILNYNITLSELVSIQQVGTSTQFIQVPNVTSRSLLQSVRIHSGDTIVLAGFKRTDNSLADRGVGKPNFWLFGGGTTTSNDRQQLIILITPVILENNDQLMAAQR